MGKRTGTIINLVIWIPLIILLIIGLTALSDSGDVFGATAGWLSAGLFSMGVLSAGLFSIGVYSAGLYSVGVFSSGVFSVGIVSFGTYTVGIWSFGQYPVGIFTRKIMQEYSSRK